jgi:hypothetical protein
MHVIGKLADLVLNRVSKTKYSDLDSPIVDIHINGTTIPNNLIDLRAAINIMT